MPFWCFYSSRTLSREMVDVVTHDCVCAVAFVRRGGGGKRGKAWKSSNVLWEESVTLLVSLGADSPQGRKHCRRRRQAWEVAEEGKEMMRWRRDEGGGGRESYTLKNSLVCRCAGLNMKCREHLVFTIRLKRCIYLMMLDVGWSCLGYIAQHSLIT